MPQQLKPNQLPLVGRILLYSLAAAYLVYMVALGNFLYTSVSALSPSIVELQVNTNPTVVFQHWTVASMLNATSTDPLFNNTAPLTQESLDTNKGNQQQGQLPGNGEPSYPLSTVGKVFFSNSAGQNYVCSGTAVASLNHNVVDTAGHCLYFNGGWMKNVIFCPLFDHGNTPYDCWAARALEVPADWINAKPNDLHHDFGMAIVAPNSQGDLTDVVGGAGWAYNQSVNQPFFAYGYPAGYPFDGQSRKTCEASTGKSWQHGGGTVVSIPCDMTGGSSGGPWFIKIDGNFYLNGHNDFISSMMPKHMFSPYYDDTWYALYNKAQNT